MILFSCLLFTEHVLRGRIFSPLFYKKDRISQGKIFTLYKFNIFKQEILDDMRNNNEFIHTKDLENNGGLIFIGKILKQIYLDESPQLFSILYGKISLVGPRPLNTEVFEKISENEKVARINLKAGITGNFQSFKNCKGKTAKELDLEYYNYFLKNINSPIKIFLFDLKIILRTIKVILRAKGV